MEIFIKLKPKEKMQMSENFRISINLKAPLIEIDCLKRIIVNS